MKTTWILNLLIVAAIAMVNAPTAMAQSEAVRDTEKLISAIEKMESLDEVIFSGTAETPELKDACPMAGIQVIVNGDAGSKSKTFNERFELKISPQDGDVLICSEEKLPGVAIYQNEDQTISSTTFGDEEFETKDLACDLPQIFNLENLSQYVGKVKKCEVEENDGVTSYSCSLPKRFVRNRSAAGPQSMLAASIKSIDGKFQVDSEGELASIVVKVVRENPMAKMMKMGGKMELQGSNMDDLDPGIQAQVEAQLAGDVVVEYTLNRESAPSDRTEKMLKEMRSLITE